MIGVLGISHKTAPINIREVFSINILQINDLASYLSNLCNITEIVILSTCNRTEIYFYQDKINNDAFQKLIVLFHKYLKLSEDFSNHFYFFKNNEAVQHLFSVTSGLDSMVIGEDQIVKQVKEAYIHCTDNSWTDAILMRLFQKSFETSKMVRSKTAIQQGATSISYLAVEKCQKVLGNLRNKSVLFVGTGETGRLVLQKMKKTGITNFTFSNRTKASSENLVKENNGRLIDFSSFKDHIYKFDIIVTATNAGKFLLHADDIDKSVNKRGNKKQVFIDLSVPRNIQFSDIHYDNAEVIVIDDLQEMIDLNSAKREESIKDAQLIVSEMTDSFYTWYNNRALKPVIQSITKNIEEIHQNEIDGYTTCYTTETFDAINQYATRLTKKYIRKIIKNLIDMNEKGEYSNSLDAIRELFIFEPNKD